MDRTAKLLILDLDETLISAHEKSLEDPPDFKVCDIYHVYRRPYLTGFLAFCLQNFRVAVWSSATEDYAEQIVKNIFPDPDALNFVWARKKCTFRRNPGLDICYYIKDLKKVKRLGYDLNHVLVVDDDAYKLERHYGNHIPVKPFKCASDDRELVLLQKYLQKTGTVSNVRKIEKRLWRSEIFNAE